MPALLLLLAFARGADALAPCAASAEGEWCTALRVEGTTAECEMGFRFGEPMDMDGDGRADIAAGTRFEPQPGATSQDGALRIWSGADGRLIRHWPGVVFKGLFGHWALPLGDLDGDGLADVVASAPAAVAAPGTQGVLSARSPRSGEVLWRRLSDREELLGWDLAPAGDQDGDRVDDFFAGAPSAAGGRVLLVSGRDGATLRTYAPEPPRSSFGWILAGLGDVDGDGRGDLVVGGLPGSDAPGDPVQEVFLVSAASGRVLQHWRDADRRTSFGEMVAGVGDLDRDGLDDVVVTSSFNAEVARGQAGFVQVFSSRSGREIHRWNGRQPGEIYGRMAADAGDVDGDGVHDVAVGAPWHRASCGDKAGRAEIRSGRTGDVLAEWTGEVADAWFGWHIRRAPDPEGRGRPALLVGSLRQVVGGRSGVGAIEWITRRGPR